MLCWLYWQAFACSPAATLQMTRKRRWSGEKPRRIGSLNSGLLEAPRYSPRQHRQPPHPHVAVQACVLGLHGIDWGIFDVGPPLPAAPDIWRGSSASLASLAPMSSKASSHVPGSSFRNERTDGKQQTAPSVPRDGRRCLIRARQNGIASMAAGLDPIPTLLAQQAGGPGRKPQLRPGLDSFLGSSHCA